MAAPQEDKTERLLLAGGVLLGIAGLVGLVGTLVGARGLLSQVQRRIKNLDVPPGELALRSLQRARNAVGAGAKGWQQEVPGQGDGNVRAMRHAPTSSN
ncbi:MAG TPA: hypothetical protein VE152_03855 [Acidimicrobiales bacterium]|jgi:hypothetical protein|nr:hypothetical protein [Acidimicrobiales bacterium]